MPFEDPTSQDRKANEGDTGENTSTTTEGNQPFLVTEDGRVFETKEDLIKSWQNAQGHISKLESERTKQAELEAAEQAKAQQSEIASEVLETVRSELNSRKADEDQSQASKAELSKDELKALIKEELSAVHSETKKQANNDACMDAAKEVYGDSYNKVVAEKAALLGMSMDDVNDMANRSPAAFKELFVPKKERGVNFSGDVNTSAVDQTLQGRSAESNSIAKVNSAQAGMSIQERMAASGVYELDQQELKRKRY